MLAARRTWYNQHHPLSGTLSRTMFVTLFPTMAVSLSTLPSVTLPAPLHVAVSGPVRDPVFYLLCDTVCDPDFRPFL